MTAYTRDDFSAQFPDDSACLEWLKEFRWPDGIFCKHCRRIVKHHRLANRPSYSCDRCGNHVHPTAGTIYEKSTTPLRLWFYAIYLMTSAGGAMSAKGLQRELGVTYKTAWRMRDRILGFLRENDAAGRGGAKGGHDGYPASGESARFAEGFMRLTLPKTSS